MRSNNCDIGTLASSIKDNSEIIDPNVVKVSVDQTLKDNSFLEARDFFRKKEDLINDKIYHHLGLYIFTKDALTRYVKLTRSKLEIERNLEQMRAMENNMIIKVGLAHAMPLSVDTKEDLRKIKKEMEKL
jgi:3-deoxy-manno-octulosonate cytidylyltransferase (CMP-KDO synthetase)